MSTMQFQSCQVRFMRLASALLALLLSCAPLAAQSPEQSAILDRLFARLQDPNVGAEVLRIEPQIWTLWMTSGNEVENKALRLATDAMNRGAYTEADAQLTAILATSPTFAEAWNKRATLYFLMGRYEESLSDIVKTLELEPRHFGALSGRGMIYTKLGRYPEAIAAYEEALAIHPQLVGARLSLQQLREIAPDL